MRLFIVLCCAILLVSSSCAQVFTESNNLPFLFVSKTASAINVPLGSGFEVSVTITNFGDSDAYDVQVIDLLKNGTELTRNVHALETKGTLSYNYTVVPTELGHYEVGITHVNYNLESGNAGTQATALSNMVHDGSDYYIEGGAADIVNRGRVTVLSSNEYKSATRSEYFSVACFVGGVLLYILVPYLCFRSMCASEEVLLKRTKYMK